MKVLELFAGIGACSKALTNLGIEHEIVDAVEIDKYAIKSFNAIHGTDFEPQDITKWDKDIECDLIMHGSPCQDFSVAGKGAGGDKDSGTRSSLMYETLRIVEKLKPKYVIWENVKNLLSKKHRHNFDAYLEAMENLGYTNFYRVLNAKDYGVPQNRERVFTVSILGDKIIYDDYNSSIRKDQDTIGTLTTNCGAQAPRNGWKIIEEKINFEFPEPEELKTRLKDVLDKEVDEKFYLNDKLLKTYQRNFGSKGKELKGDTSPTLTASMGSGGANTPYLVEDFYKNRPVREYSETSPTLRSERIGLKVVTVDDQEPTVVASRGRGENNEQHLESRKDGLTNTITSVQKDNYVAEPGYRIRKLTPKECWRLMGFDDSDFEKAEKVNSNSQLYKQAGNSIVVNVLEKILSNLLENK